MNPADPGPTIGAAPGADPDTRRWLIHPAVDLGLLLGPALLAVGIALILPRGLALGALGWLLLVVFVDVAHVYATLYRTYLDPDARQRLGARLVVLPLGCLVVSAAVCALSETLFWTALAYLAVFHFVRQQAGIAMLYRVREGLPAGDGAARLERWAHYAVTGAPVLWWHAHLPRSFEWFVPGDFVPGLPPLVAGLGAALGALVVGAHGSRRWREGRPAGRDLWLLATAAVWTVGIVVTDSDAAFTATNVLLHGIPYTVLVFWVKRRQAPAGGRSWFFAGGLVAAVALLLGLALLEEGLWDALVWAEHPQFFGRWSPPTWLSAAAVPVLSVPQLTHYLLDGRIWRIRSGDEALRRVVVPGAR